MLPKFSPLIMCFASPISCSFTVNSNRQCEDPFNVACKCLQLAAGIISTRERLHREALKWKIAYFSFSADTKAKCQFQPHSLGPRGFPSSCFSSGPLTPTLSDRYNLGREEGPEGICGEIHCGGSEGDKLLVEREKEETHPSFAPSCSFIFLAFSHHSSLH